MSNFLLVSKMNEIFGNPYGDLKNIDWEKCKMYAELIKEELEETIYAIENKDINQLIDGNMDILVVAYGLSHVAGIDADKGMDIVNESNMSKLCPNLIDANKTLDFYKDEVGIDTFIENINLDGVSHYVVKSTYDQIDNNAKFYPKGKFLKCITSFKEPDFNSLFY